MEDDDHEEEQEEEPSYETLGNSSIFKITSESGDPSASTHKPPTRYRECLKNHAVSLGRHAVDGCGEFIPLGLENTPDSLKCAACNCHRNFHRKEDTQQHDISPYYRTTPTGYPHVSQHYRPLPLPSSSGGGTHSREDQDDVSNPSGSGGSRKRFRTKFTQEQKEKMLGFAEKLGWKIQKQDEGLVEEFCNDTCIKRRVLKVWMHNNKYTLGKNPNPNNNIG